MYIVRLKNGDNVTEIHNASEKLKSGSVVKGINSIDSFSFTLLPSNIGFNMIRDFSTLVEVYNTNKSRYEFKGRVLYSRPAMNESGLLTKEVICESYFGFLCDSRQKYVDPKNWTVRELLQTILDCHNSQVEEYKRFTIGELTVEDSNDNLYIGIQRESTWKTIEEKLIKKLGGEIRFRMIDGLIYLDYLKEIGETRTTKIKKSWNMKSISQENDPTSLVTRLIPLGAKIKDVNGNETEERLDIKSVNNGLEYIDVEDAIESYGIHVEYVYFDNVNLASTLFKKGQDWLTENNRVQVKYSISALDLSILGLDIDDFNVHDYHPIENDLLGIRDTARIIKKTIDVCDETSSTIEVGDKFKTLTDIQQDQSFRIDNLLQNIEETKSEIIGNISDTESSLEQIIYDQSTSVINTSREIIMSALEEYVKMGAYDEFRQSVETQFSVLAGEISMKFSQIITEINNVDGDLQTKYTEIVKYIRFIDGKIVIGIYGDPFQVEISNNRISFKQNGVEVAYMSNNNLYIGNAVIKSGGKLQLGNFAFVPRSNGSLSFLKVGEVV